MRAKVWPKWIGGAQAALSRAVDFFGRVAKISPWMAEGMIALAFGLAVGLAAWSGGHLAGLESATLDWRLRTFPRPGTASRDIVLVLIDQNSILHFEKQLGRWPWKRSAYPPMLEVFRRGGARLIVFDILFSERSEEEEDKAFAAALAARRDVVLAFQVAHPADEKRIGGKQEFPPLGPPAGSLRPLRLPNWGPAVPPLDALAGGALGFGQREPVRRPGRRDAPDAHAAAAGGGYP